jgi:AcrR family transcriptional regulator
MAKSGIESRRQAALAEGSTAYTARRQEIVRVAADVFREKGYEVATLNDIAERLGTDRASLYYYFGNKEEVLHEIVRGVLHENVDMAERVAGGSGTSAEKLEALIIEMMASFERHYPAMYVYVEDLARISREDSEWAEDVSKSSKRFEDIVTRLLKKGQAEGSIRADLPPDITALALFGMVNWTHQWWRPKGKRSAIEVADVFAKVFLEGAETQG